ncbi:angiopoietin-related protein 4-like [Ruditapes philippinarum]|uniref:angiopoietin-related protein 4-like n=1 Tax=Ruditapes philippinarum TaxID=129788 RepID=UPI00295BD311|nr:angiopoietin-related protein 4-like [Ruditapes philippinarum]
MACSKICFLHNKCLTSVYQPEHVLCIGCEAMSFQPLPNTSNSIQYTRRDFKVDCKDAFQHALKNNKNAETGVYEIRLPSLEIIDVYCDMTSDGGGWTVIQNRIDGSTSFNKSFQAYEDGFGDIRNEFWLGLKYIQEITDAPSKMRVVVNGDASLVNFKLLGEHYIFSDGEDLKEESINFCQNFV